MNHRDDAKCRREPCAPTRIVRWEGREADGIRWPMIRFSPHQPDEGEKRGHQPRKQLALGLRKNIREALPPEALGF